MPNENPEAKAVAKLTLNSLQFSYNSYPSPGHWTCTARVGRSKDGYSGASDITLKVDSDVAEKLMLAIAPIMVDSASKAAQELADETIALANALSASLQKSIADTVTV